MFAGDLSIQRFLAEYWQKKPLLIRKAFPAFRDPLSAEELAGLACEEAAEARLVFSNDGQWRMQQGPFSEADFTALPAGQWTLLVQAVDHWFPHLKALATRFGFLPAWRIDDIMVSYATEGAGVGPHFDYYDVFIIQGEGRRHWQIGQYCTAADDIDDSSGLKILRNFTKKEDFELEAGDVLYIPPGFSHWGTALDNNLSYSVGFRAPSQAEILVAGTAAVCARLSEDQRYSDPDLQASNEPGLIADSVGERLLGMLQTLLTDKTLLVECFGRFMTESKYPEQAWLPEAPLSEAEFSRLLTRQGNLQKHPASRFAYTQSGQQLKIFADGESFTFEKPSEKIQSLASLLGNPAFEEISSLDDCSKDPDCLALLLSLYNQGSLIETESE